MPLIATMLTQSCLSKALPLLRLVMDRWAQCYLKIPMVKNLIFLFLTNIISIVSPSQFVLENKNSHYYQEKIQWNVKEQNFKDTIVLFRNYIKGISKN